MLSIERYMDSLQAAFVCAMGSRVSQEATHGTLVRVATGGAEFAVPVG